MPDLCEEFGYLSIEPKGRLGNFISQYATLYGYSKYYGISPVIDPFMRDGLRHMFKHLSIPVYTNKTCKSPFYCEVENSVLSQTWEITLWHLQGCTSVLENTWART